MDPETSFFAAAAADSENFVILTRFIFYIQLQSDRHTHTHRETDGRFDDS